MPPKLPHPLETLVHSGTADTLLLRFSHMKTGALTISCLALAASALLGSGCASICFRTGHTEPDVPGIYPGVYPGPQLIIYEMQTPRGVAHNIMVWPCGIIDFPLSTALDTALLPFDLPYWACTRDSKEPSQGNVSSPKQQANGG
jgi:uncharacterized protein YceK